MTRISFLILIVSYLIIITSRIGLSANELYELQKAQNLIIQELQKTVFDLELESSLLPKTLTPEQKAKIVAEIVSRIGGSTADVLTPEQKAEIVTEIISRIGGF